MLLTTKPQALHRNLIMASDFVQDTANGVSPFPPKIMSGASASGVRVALLLVQPTQEYLTRLKLTASELFTIVRGLWASGFLAIGAPTVIALPADAVPAG